MLLRLPLLQPLEQAQSIGLSGRAGRRDRFIGDLEVGLGFFVLGVLVGG